VLVTAALADGWVPCHEPAKYAAKLRAVTTGPGPVLLACFPDAGHHGAPGRRNRYDEPAVAAAFVLDQVAPGGAVTPGGIPRLRDIGH
jgi:oligopeptidase B